MTQITDLMHDRPRCGGVQKLTVITACQYLMTTPPIQKGLQ